MLDPEDQLTTLKLIDQRQDLVLEDLERLNHQIVNIIEVYASNRTPDLDSSGSPVTATKDAA